MSRVAIIEAAVTRIREIAVGLGSPEALVALDEAASEILSALPRRPGLGDTTTTTTTSAPGSTDASQVYITAPAAGAIAVIAALAGGGAGYLVRGHLDKHKTLLPKKKRRRRQLEAEG